MRILCLDIPALGASLEKYAPHLNAEALHAWDCINQASSATSTSVRTDLASLFFLNVTLSMKR